jgi:hypothetical protein
MTFLLAFDVSASIPSGSVNVFPPDSVITSPFLSTLSIVAVVAFARPR